MADRQQSPGLIQQFIVHTFPLSVAFGLCASGSLYLVEKVHPVAGLISLVGVYGVTRVLNTWWSDRLRDRGYNHV